MILADARQRATGNQLDARLSRLLGPVDGTPRLIPDVFERPHATDKQTSGRHALQPVMMPAQRAERPAR